MCYLPDLHQRVGEHQIKIVDQTKLISALYTFVDRAEWLAAQVVNDTRSRSHPASQGLVDFACGYGEHRLDGIVHIWRTSPCALLRSMKSTRHAHASRLLPSGSGWFHKIRHAKTAAPSNTSG